VITRRQTLVKRQSLFVLDFFGIIFDVLFEIGHPMIFSYFFPFFGMDFHRCIHDRASLLSSSAVSCWFWNLTSHFSDSFLRSDILFFPFFPHFFRNRTMFSAPPEHRESDYPGFKSIFPPDLGIGQSDLRNWKKRRGKRDRLK